MFSGSTKGNIDPKWVNDYNISKRGLPEKLVVQS